MYSKNQGSVLGGILLVAGSCIGAGMLALPVITGVGGFGPAMVLFLAAWLFMVITGFLLLEVNLTLGYRLSLVSLAEKTLGSFGKILSWVLFLFLFYSLSVAYISASGEILQSIASDLFGVTLSSATGGILFTAFFGIILYAGVRQVDLVNRLLMLGLIVTYLALVFLGSRYISLDNLMAHEWKYAFAAMPILIISFGFHNMIPSLAMYLKGDAKRLRLTLFIGSVIPLAIYFVWQVVMLGMIPIDERAIALTNGEVATTTLRAVTGRGWINTAAQFFALFAITTSFLAQSLSLVDFLADGMKMAKQGLKRLFLIGLTLVPPLLFALLNPGIFIRAIQVAGGLSAVILFGVMPALMVWVLRREKPQVTVSRLVLSTVLIVGASIFLVEIAGELGLPLLPRV